MTSHLTRVHVLLALSGAWIAAPVVVGCSSDEAASVEGPARSPLAARPRAVQATTPRVGRAIRKGPAVNATSRSSSTRRSRSSSAPTVSVASRSESKPASRDRCASFQDKLGTAGCLPSSNVQNRQPRAFANDCADGHVCTNDGDGGACRMICLSEGGAPPLDASAATGGPGHGGCPADESCIGAHLERQPDWLQLCAYPDGG